MALINIRNMCLITVFMGIQPLSNTMATAASTPDIGLYREIAIAIQVEVGDSNGGNV